MGGEATKKPETWNFFVFMVYLILSFCIPPIGLFLGIYGLNKVGKRLDGFLMLVVGTGGVIYGWKLVLWMLFAIGGALQ